MKRVVASTLLTAAIFLAMAVAAVALVSTATTPAYAGPCRCPLIYGPVICDNGKTYPNQCVADCHHAQNCVPTGEL